MVARSEAQGLRSSQTNVGSPVPSGCETGELEAKMAMANRAKTRANFVRGHVSLRSFLRVVLEPCKQHSAGTAGFSGWLTVHAQCFDP